MTMARRERLPAILTAAFALALAGGCGAVPDKHFYAIVNQPEAAGPAGARPVCARSVVVSPMDIAVPYDDDRIVFRTGTYEVKYFDYDLWVSRPQDMFQQLLAQKLERARLFDAVEPQLSSARTHLTLIATIDAVELIATGELIEARLAMTLRLRDDDADRTIWEHAFDTRRPVPNQGRDVNVEETVRTLNGIYAAEAANAVSLLRAFLPSYAGCAAAQ
jgi:ABC-type uncharacterized transport system auxiliary subunit